LTFVGKWGSSGTGDGQFNGGGDVAVDATGTVFVGDATRIQAFAYPVGGQ
jgi:hypothetical protein